MRNYNTAYTVQKSKKVVIISIILSFIVSCKKFLDVGGPVTSTNSSNIYVNNNSAISVLTALYTDMSGDFYSNSGLTSLSVTSELSADNLALFNLDAQQYLIYYKNSYNATSNVPLYWSKFYSQIYITNAAIEGLMASTTLNKVIKERLLGEALFTRAIYYFYLVNLYGDVPLVTATDYSQSAIMPRTSTIEVYAQIVNDLIQAQKLMDDQFLDGTLLQATEDRVRPNRMAAAALLARTYLYQKNYRAAEASASEVINNSSLFNLVPIDQVFLRNSQETIWALQPVKTDYNTDEANTFLLPTGPNNLEKPFYLSASLMQSFKEGDKRKLSWTDAYYDGNSIYPYSTKYKVAAFAGSSTPSEFSIVLRLAEQYLIRAEARAEQNNIDGAVQDINALRTRARAEATIDIPDPLPNLPITLTLAQTRRAILEERRIELFTEYGHRWFDIKRSEKIDTIMQAESKIKGSTWSSYKALLPIPTTEIILNKNIKQNPNYN
jgi:hypothetical protein